MKNEKIKNNLSVDEIHEIREKHYEKTKNYSKEKLAKSINSEANEVMKIIEEKKKGKMVM